MTYNMFGGTLNLTQSINPVQFNPTKRNHASKHVAVAFAILLPSLQAFFMRPGQHQLSIVQTGDGHAS